MSDESSDVRLRKYCFVMEGMRTTEYCCQNNQRPEMPSLVGSLQGQYGTHRARDDAYTPSSGEQPVEGSSKRKGMTYV